jgi:LPXTG-motif cell wall-anchored protein
MRAARARTSGAYQHRHRENSNKPTADYSMLLIGATLAIGAGTVLWILRRRRKSSSLDYLGTVSPRWIADERASSHDGLR